MLVHSAENRDGLTDSSDPCDLSVIKNCLLASTLIITTIPKLSHHPETQERFVDVLRRLLKVNANETVSPVVVTKCMQFQMRYQTIIELAVACGSAMHKIPTWPTRTNGARNNSDRCHVCSMFATRCSLVYLCYGEGDMQIYKYANICNSIIAGRCSQMCFSFICVDWRRSKK